MIYKTDIRVGNSPCKDCPKRHELCWDSCEEYLAWKKRKEAVKELDREHRDKEWMMSGYEINRLAKARRRRLREE